MLLQVLNYPLVEQPMQVAIDSAGGELYWTDFTGTVSRASVVSTCASTEDSELNRVACVCGEDVSGESARLAATLLFFVIVRWANRPMGAP